MTTISWDKVKHKGWYSHRDITAAEKRRINTLFTELDRNLLELQNKEYVKLVDELYQKFNITNVLTKEREKWLVNKVNMYKAINRFRGINTSYSKKMLDTYNKYFFNGRLT